MQVTIDSLGFVSATGVSNTKGLRLHSEGDESEKRVNEREKTLQCFF